MRAIIINPHDQTITEVEHDGTLEGMYASLKCQCVQLLQLSPSECLWIDDSGGLKRGNPVFRFRDFHQPLAGIAMILGVTRGGNNRETKISVEDVAKWVAWTDDETTGRFAPTRTMHAEEDKPFVIGGQEYDFISIGGAPIMQPRTKAGAA